MIVTEVGLIIFFALFASLALLACTTKDVGILIVMGILTPVIALLFLFICVVVPNFILN